MWMEWDWDGFSFQLGVYLSWVLRLRITTRFFNSICEMFRVCSKWSMVFSSSVFSENHMCCEMMVDFEKRVAHIHLCVHGWNMVFLKPIIITQRKQFSKKKIDEKKL